MFSNNLFSQSNNQQPVSSLFNNINNNNTNKSIFGTGSIMNNNQPTGMASIFG